jgi:hypothetical protein
LMDDIEQEVIPVGVGLRHASNRATTGTLEFFTGSMVESLFLLRIHYILVWIRIRGSMPPTNGSGSGSFYFSSVKIKALTEN